MYDFVVFYGLFFSRKPKNSDRKHRKKPKVLFGLSAFVAHVFYIRQISFLLYLRTGFLRFFGFDNFGHSSGGNTAYYRSHADITQQMHIV